MGVIRKTKSVERLLNIFEQVENALSIVELVNQLQSKMNRSTVYRILKRLEDEGQLHSFIGKDGLKWYARCQKFHSSHNDLHPHFQCSNCGKTECLPVDFSIPSFPNYKIESAQLLMVGRCEECLSK